MKDIARQAGVSVTTVSHTLNGTRYVSPQLKQRVVRAAEDLGYRGRGAGRLDGDSRTVGLLIPSARNLHFMELYRMLEGALNQAGHRVLFCCSEEDPDRELACLRLFEEKRADALLLIQGGRTNAILKEIRRNRRPTILIDRDPPETDVDRVLVDNRRGGYEATQHLLALGHRRIAALSGGIEPGPAGERLKGYKDAMVAAGLEPVVIHRGFDLDGGYHGLRELLLSPNPPTGVFAVNDVTAFGVLHGAAEQGIAVPRQLSVVGFDDVELAQYAVPALTTVRQPRREIVATVVDRLGELFSGAVQLESKRVELNGLLVPRRSTAAPGETSRNNTASSERFVSS